MSKSYAIGINIFGNERRYNISFDSCIYCYNESLVSLTIYDEENLLSGLYCENNVLENVNIIGGKNIAYIWCYNNKLKEFDLSTFHNLEVLRCDINLENDLKLPNHKLILLNFMNKYYI